MDGSRSIARHAHLVSEMADVAGLDLADEMIAGRLTGEGLRQAVVRCMDCSDVEGCARMLAARSGGSEPAVPDFCRNIEFFAELGEEMVAE
jgi:hypothetical protein